MEALKQPGVFSELHPVYHAAGDKEPGHWWCAVRDASGGLLPGFDLVAQFPSREQAIDALSKLYDGEYLKTEETFYLTLDPMSKVEQVNGRERCVHHWMFSVHSDMLGPFCMTGFVRDHYKDEATVAVRLAFNRLIGA